jgi:hypothetical protein
MNIKTKTATLIGSATAALTIGVLSVGFAGAAWATDPDPANSDVDVIEVEAEETAPNAFELNLFGHNHDDDSDFDPEAVTYEVEWDASGYGLVSAIEGVTNNWLGFAVDGDASFASGAVVDNEVQLTLVDAYYDDDSTAHPGTGKVVLDGTAVNFDTSSSLPQVSDLPLANASPQFHEHPEWRFYGTGYYELEFSVTTVDDGATVTDPASTVLLTFYVD